MKTGSTLQELAQTLETQRATKRDFVAPTRKLELINPKGKDLRLLMHSSPSQAFDIEEIAHGQIAERLKIPRRYYDRMRTEAPDLLCENVNTWFNANPEQRMIRTIGGNARAFLSNRYRPLDNIDLAESTLPTLAKLGCNIVSAELTAGRMYIKALLPKIQAEVVKGDVVQAGIVISNSEVGMGSVRVEPLVFRLVCSNGMIANDAAMRKYHVGRSGAAGDLAEEFFRDETRQADDKAFWMKVQDVVRGALNQDVFTRIVTRMAEAKGHKIEGDPVKVVEVFQKRHNLSDDERGGVLKHLVSGGDMSQYGLLNAVTRLSQDVPDYERATDLERLGGQVLELPKSEWEVLSRA